MQLGDVELQAFLGTGDDEVKFESTGKENMGTCEELFREEVSRAGQIRTDKRNIRQAKRIRKRSNRTRQPAGARNGNHCIKRQGARTGIDRGEIGISNAADTGHNPRKDD